MKKTTLHLLTVAGVLLLTGCVRDPYLFQPYYQPPAPAPLQPYVEPAVAPVGAHRRVARRHYHRKHYRQVRCPCTQPVQ